MHGTFMPSPAARAARNALAYACREDFAGYDPFDGLNSSLFQATPVRRARLARLAWLQLFKLSPVNLRALAGVPKMRNPKGVALFVMGLLELARCSPEDEALLARARRLGDWLVANRADRSVWGHSAWGYHFPWQARAFYVERGAPNAITTCYVATALRRLGAATGDQRYADAACDAGLFLDRHLFVHGARGVRYYGYVPGDPTLVHNANLWAAALVAEAAAELGDGALDMRAYDAAQHSVAAQHGDGSWEYGTQPHHRFIDGFHTGYNLEALARLGAALRTTDFHDSIAAGYAYYKATFIAPDGRVAYYAHRPWPEETHGFAQAVLTLLLLGGGKDAALAERVVERGLSRLYCERAGTFAYRRTPLWTNRIPYMRWSQAWAFLALAAFAAHGGDRA